MVCAIDLNPPKNLTGERCSGGLSREPRAGLRGEGQLHGREGNPAALPFDVLHQLWGTSVTLYLPSVSRAELAPSARAGSSAATSSSSAPAARLPSTAARGNLGPLRNVS
jgi:hypothetical protein